MDEPSARSPGTAPPEGGSGERDPASLLLEHLRERREEMLELLGSLARLESPTRAPERQAPVQEAIAGELDALGWETRRLSGRDTGGHLYARPSRRRRGAPFQLLLGHTDTVWPVGTTGGPMPVEVDGETVRGPGVFDMKGGLVQLVFALRALDALGLEPDVLPVVLVNSDEEIGSPESGRHIRRLARRACRALVFEPALGPAGALKTARKGTGRFEVRVTGRSAHVGLAPEEGASAIQELTHVVQALHELSDREEGVSVNVGEIEGGMRPNVVAPAARAVVDVRVPTAEAGREAERAVRALEAVTPGTRLEVSGSMGRPPMEPTPGNRALWRAARRAGRRLGLDLEEGTSGGASDGNLTSQWTPTLDGLGPVGDGAHAEHEHVRIAPIAERAALAALLILLPEDLEGVDEPRAEDGAAPGTSPRPGGGTA